MIPILPREQRQMSLKTEDQRRLETPKSCSDYCDSSAKLLFRQDSTEAVVASLSESEERGDSATFSCLLISFKGKESFGKRYRIHAGLMEFGIF